jgi:hypothetical protein
MNLRSAYIANPIHPAAPLAEARLTCDLLLAGPGDYDPIRQIDFAIDRLREARGRLASLAADSE